MAQLQFRSDDTIQWLEGFGDGSDGDLTISGNTTEAPIDASCTGTAGQTSLSATNASFATGQIILIHKSRGSTTTPVGTWELNKITNYSAGTITLKYALQNSYQDSGADQSQVRVLKQYNNVTVNNGVTWTVKAWNGDVGGILAFCAKGTVSGVTAGVISVAGGNASGTTGGTGGGYRGGNGVDGSSVTAYCGEGTAGDRAQQNGARGNGGGGGVSGPTGGTNPSGYGGGGGHTNAGTAGGVVSTGTGGAAGNGSIGNAGLTVAAFGGAGGGNGTSNAYYQGAGGAGGGFFLALCNAIDLTALTININGGNASTSGGAGVTGGAGAGGSGLIKAKTAVLGTNKMTASAGTSSGGGVGSVGRLHLDYKTSTSGTTTPSLDARQDATLDWVSGATGNFFMFM